MFGVPRRTIHLYRGELLDLARAATAPANEQRALVAAFEDAMARHLGVRHAIPVGAGRLGLRLILQGLQIGPGDAVMLPAFTDESVPDAIIKVGARPVFVDIDPTTLNLDPTQLKKALQPGVRAILATHLFGAPCDVAAIEAFAAQHGLVVLEDCAHAVDARSQGRRCGAIGEAAIFSFVVTKAVNTFGGGLVATNSDPLAAFIRRATRRLPLPNPRGLLQRIVAGYTLAGLTHPTVFTALGRPAMAALAPLGTDALAVYDRVIRPATINAHQDTAFSPIQAAAGLAQLRRLPETQAARRRNAELLRAALPSWLVPQAQRDGDQHAWYFLVALAEAPADAVQRLRRVGIDVGRQPMRNVAALARPKPGRNRFPNAEQAFQTAIQLPIHPSLSAGVAQRIAQRLRQLA